MYFLRRRYNQKPRQWGPISSVRSAIRDWYERHGMAAPVLYYPQWEHTGGALHNCGTGPDVAITGADWQNRVLDFNGTSDECDIGSIGTTFGANDDFFLFAIADCDTGWDGGQIINNRDASNLELIRIGLVENQWRFQWYPLGGTGSAAATINRNSNLEPILATRNSAEITISTLANGTVTTTGSTGAISTDRWSIGSWADGNGEYFDGRIGTVILGKSVPGDIDRLLNFPHEALQPRSIPYYSIPVTAGTTIPIFLHHYNQMRR